MAKMWGEPNYPVIYTAHPIASLTEDELRSRAESIVDQIVYILTGVELPQY